MVVVFFVRCVCFLAIKASCHFVPKKHSIAAVLILLPLAIVVPKIRLVNRFRHVLVLFLHVHAQFATEESDPPLCPRPAVPDISVVRTTHRPFVHVGNTNVRVPPDSASSMVSARVRALTVFFSCRLSDDLTTALKGYRYEMVSYWGISQRPQLTHLLTSG